MMKIIECPRDAMQGLAHFVPTSKKIAYLNRLLKVGFDTLDFGSFVSPKAIPQMRDTREVLAGLDMESSNTSLLAIVANERGVRDALMHHEIDYLGFPFSISETFQQRNAKSTIAEALATLNTIQELVSEHKKELVVYLSMGFGNPYGDPYSYDIVKRHTANLVEMGIQTLSLSDTVGSATAVEVGFLFNEISKEFTDIELGVHLHANPVEAKAKVSAALEAGCQRFDGALRGYGGCPMAKDELVGNVPTEVIIEVLEQNNVPHGLNMEAFVQSLAFSADVF